MLSTSAFRDFYTKGRSSHKLNSRKIGPFPIIELICRNAVRLDLPPTMRIHSVINVSHTLPYFARDPELQEDTLQTPPPIVGPQGIDYEPDRILQHRRRGTGHQFLVEWKGYPSYEATWEPTRNFLDEDGTVHESLETYLHENNLNDEVVIPRRWQ